jgi:hypothetical protein
MAPVPPCEGGAEAKASTWRRKGAWVSQSRVAANS